MGTQTHFRIEPRLIQILGAQYRSTEEAIKELVANAWDADATRVEISLPEPFAEEPIVVHDNGYGMTPAQIEAEYLCIAFDRRANYGDRTPRGRTVRGRKGIGKFAGLMAADTMIIDTVAHGKRSRLQLNRAQIEQQGSDLEKAAIVVETVPASSGCESGTRVELHKLLQTFSYPASEKLARLLLREFGRRDDFAITIGGDVLTPYFLDAEAAPVDLNVPSVGVMSGTIWITETPKAVSEPGVIIRIDGRAVGPPTFFGLEADPDVPKSLLNRVCGEVNADQLRDDVLASWGGFIENSIGHQELVEVGRKWLRDLLLQRRDQEAGRAPEAFVEGYAEEIEKLPPSRRDLARRALMQLFKRFWDEPEDKKRAIAELVLNAFEADEYWVLVQRIDETPREDILRLAEILRLWGISEVAGVVERARRRMKAVEAFEKLIADRSTLELTGVHHALEQNAWLIGDQYELLKSNRGLRGIVEKVFGVKYRGSRAKHRPDLLLVGLQERYLLIELKKPAEQIGRNDVSQGQTYRDELRAHLPNGDIYLAVIGGSVDPYLQRDDYDRTLVTTFDEVAQGARSRLQWLIEHLEQEGEDDRADPDAAAREA